MRHKESEAIAELLLQVFRRVLAAQNSSELKPAQWSALRFLSRADQSARTNKAFAAYHQTTTGTVTVTLKALVVKKLVKRIPDKNDRRLVRFELTDHGWRVLSCDPVNRLVEAIASLDKDRRSDLTDVLTHLLLSNDATYPKE